MLTEKQVIRSLSPFETFFTVASASVWISVRLQGALNSAILDQALEALRTAYPVLSYHIEQGEQGYQLVTDGRDLAGLRIREGQIPAQPEMRVLALEESLIAVDVVSQGNEHLVSIGIHHGIADARASLYYVKEFWVLYTRIASTGSPSVSASAPVPLAPEQVLRERHIPEQPHSGIQKIAGSIWGGRNQVSSSQQRPAGGRSIRLDAETTAALRLAGKAKGLTLHGAVCGAILKAERLMITHPSEGSVPLGVRTATDIRDRLDPPIGVVESTNLVAMAFSQVQVDTTSDIGQLGATVVDELAKDISENVVQQQIYHTVNDLLSPQFPSLYVTNVGVLHPVDTPDELTVTGMSGDVLLILPDAIPGGHDPAESAASMYMVFSFEGNLVIEARYPEGAFTEENMDVIARTIEDQLTTWE